MLASYYPEMNEKKPDGQIEARLGHYGKHWFLRTPLTLKGRGVDHLGIETAESLVPSAQHKAGWNRYKVTENAFAKICEVHSVVTESLL